MFRVAVDVDTSGDNVVIAAPTNNQCIAIISYRLIPAAPVTVQLKSKGAVGANLTGVMSGIAGTPLPGWPIPANPCNGQQFIHVCNVNEALNIVLGSGVQVGGSIEYDYVPNGYPY